MISFDEFLAKSGLDPVHHSKYQRRLDGFFKAYPAKHVYTPEDIRTYCNGKPSVINQMNPVAKYLRLSLQLTGETKENSSRIDPQTVIPQFLADMKRKGYRERTVIGVEAKLKQFIGFLRSVQINGLEEVDRQVIGFYKDHLFRTIHSKGRQYSIACQKQSLYLVRKLYEYLIAQEYPVNDPCRGMKLPREEKKISRNYLTVKEAERLLSVIDTENVAGFTDRTMFELAYSTGLRPGELCKLEMKDINLEDNLVTVKDGKGGKDRVVVLTEIAKRFLDLYIREVRARLLQNHSTSDYVFPTANGKTKGNGFMVSKIRYYRTLADIKNPVTFYAFRRSFATHLLLAGVEPRIIQELLGHDSISVTMQYLNITAHDLRRVLVKCHPREKKLAGQTIAFKGCSL